MGGVGGPRGADGGPSRRAHTSSGKPPAELSSLSMPSQAALAGSPGPVPSDGSVTVACDDRGRTVTDDDLRALLCRARGLGLRVRRNGDRLRIESDQGWHAELAREILSHKPRITALLEAHAPLEFDAFTARVAGAFRGTIVDDSTCAETRRAAPFAPEEETGMCNACGAGRWWKLTQSDGRWVCGRCHPPLHSGLVTWVEVP